MLDLLGLGDGRIIQWYESAASGQPIVAVTGCAWAGRRALDAERSTWRDFSAAVTGLLQPAPPAPVAGAP